MSTWISRAVALLSVICALLAGTLGASPARAEVCLGEVRPTLAALNVQPASEEPNASAMRYALLAGVRGGASDLISPQVVLAVAYGMGALEVGATLGIEPLYIDVPDRILESRQGGAVPLSVHAGGRFAEGSFDLFAGGRTGLAHIFTLKDRDTKICDLLGSCSRYFADHRILEWRLGGYAGFAVPRDSSVRFRSEVGFDIALPTVEERPLTPLWALNALVGLELAP